MTERRNFRRSVATASYPAPTVTPGYAFWPQALVRLLHDLGASRDEFWDW
ncbi:MAG TPA: hypothetical protein VMV23_01555 [Candidatus Nanopelagicaceae bacterium]|nr:hypothetical protein [Candidatus Nanopelagicaceae bacterium]